MERVQSIILYFQKYGIQENKKRRSQNFRYLVFFIITADRLFDVAHFRKQPCSSGHEPHLCFVKLDSSFTGPRYHTYWASLPTTRLSAVPNTTSDLYFSLAQPHLPTMTAASASYDGTWGSDAEQENGRLTPQGSRPSFSINQTPISPSGTPGDSEANDADPDSAFRPKISRSSAETTLLRKTGWLVLRSTAKSLNNMLRNIGVSGLRVRQMYNAQVPRHWTVKCFLFLFKWAPDRGDNIKWNSETTPCTFAVPDDVATMEDDSGNIHDNTDIMFCCQSMDNASSSQALIMAVMNIPEGGGGEELVPFALGNDLTRLKAFLKPMDPVVRGAAISSSEAMRNAHNKAAREQPGGHPDLLDEDGRLHNIALADEFWMYNVYIPDRNERCVYELHGVADKPRLVGYCDKHTRGSWTSLALETIEDEVVVLQEHNTPFLLFAVTSDTKAQRVPRGPWKSKKGESGGGQTESSSGQDSSEEGKTGSSMDNRNSPTDAESERPDMTDEPDQETVKEEVDRIRATHNYDAFLIEFMKLMGSRGDLIELIRNYREYDEGDTTEEDD